MPLDAADRVPLFATRAALRVMQLGAIAAVLVATTYTVFDLDRFLVPKELVLHLTALGAGLLLLRAMRQATATRPDLLLAGYLLLSAISTVLATNHWLALRALAVSASGIAIFFAARGLREAGLARPLLNALALAVVLAAATSLLQAYGLRLELFASTRAPGGTLGNRNFVAHVAAFGFPLVLLAALHARRSFFASLGVALVAASLVLTRSRAAWLAFGVMALVFVVAILASAPLRRDRRLWRRLALVAVLAGGGVAAALLLPNALRWRSDNPYLDSVKEVANYQEGSGRGRLIQYQRSLVLAAHHPLLGAGPGNWPAVYAAHAARHDPSLDPEQAGITSNPWPSSDWIAFVSERGLAAAVLLALAFASLAWSTWRRVRAAADPEEALLAATLLCLLAAAMVAGAFDAVLLLAVPSLLIWAALGALWVPDGPAAGRQRVQRLAVVAVVIIAAIGVAYSAAQLAAIGIFSTSSDRASLERASHLDPGNYRLQLRLARSGRRQQRCAHAAAAHSLFPNAEAAREALRGCR